MNKIKDEDLKILDVKKPADNYIHIHDNLPQIPNVSCFISPPSSGKGILMINFLYRFYKDIFDTIYWFSPTLPLDNSLKSSVAIDETIIKISDHDDLKNIDKFIKMITDEQKEKYESGEKLENILVVLDDCINFVNNKSLFELCTMYRHYKITVWISIQKMKMLNNTIRSCASDIFTFQISNKQLKSFLEEYDDIDNLEHYYKLCTAKRFHWMRLNKNRIYHGSPDFIKLVYDKNQSFIHPEYTPATRKK